MLHSYGLDHLFFEISRIHGLLESISVGRENHSFCRWKKHHVLPGKPCQDLVAQGVPAREARCVSSIVPVLGCKNRVEPKCVKVTW